MPLAAGTRLGPYELLAPIGAGGMGEVWKALDTRLGRTVAVKVSRSEFTERFEREARAVAALNHPNICTLHDIGPDYLVMELLEGAPLKGPVPIETAAAYSRQILDALDAAHRKGIVHRDLKPDNILVTRQGIKLLDFGLAQQAAPKLSELDATLTRALSNKGEIAGTLQYMAPEQLQGNEADTRSDLFAFGCVLYELISGKPAFTGENAASVIAAVMERSPAPIDVPPPLDRVIRACLAKDPANRFQSAIDLKRALEWALESNPAPATMPPSRRKWLPLAIFAAALAAFGLGFLLRSPPAPDTVRYPLLLNKFSNAYGFMPPVLSPDGRQLAYVSDTVQGRRQIFVRHLDSLESQPVPGTAGVTAAAWAPDSRRMVFTGDTKIKTVDVRTGGTREIGDMVGIRLTRFGWGADGAVLYSQTSGPLLRLSESGGTPAPATALSPGDQTHDFPSFCPDGRHFLYRASRIDGQIELRLGVLDAPPRSIALQASPVSVCTVVRGTLGEEPYLVEMANNSLVAHRLDLSTGALDGVPLVIASGFVSQSRNRIVSAAGNGTLAYTIGATDPGKLTWHDRSGKVLEELPPTAVGISPAISGDDRYVAVYRNTENGNDIWVTDLTRMTSQKALFPIPYAFLPTLSPDASRIAFAGDSGIYEGPVTGGEARLVIPERAWPQQYSADGRHLLYVNVSKSNLELLSLTGDPNPVEIAPPGPTYFPATFSPGERFVVYTSNESGRPEVYVRAVPPATGKFLISREGGGMAAWRADGKELFYLSADLKLMAVDVTLSPSFQAGTPRALFQTKVGGVLRGRNNYVVSRDGRRFLILTPPDDAQTDPVYLIVNWPSLLKSPKSQ